MYVKDSDLKRCKQTRGRGLERGKEWVVACMQRCEPEGFNLLQVAKADLMKSC